MCAMKTRPPGPSRRRVWPAALFLGIVFGFTMAVVVAGRRMERTEVENLRLRSELDEARINLEKLSASLAKRAYLVIEDIELVLEGADEDDLDELKAALRRKLQVLIGKDLNTVDPEIVTELFRAVRIEAGERVYTARPVQIVLARKSFFHIRINGRDERPEE